MKQVETISLPYDLSEFTEIIDVRSPGEFAIDHLPGAINLPVLQDEERIRVGTLHKTNPFAARRLGAAIIANNAAHYLETHLADKDKVYSPLLYCWRGGMRSNSLAHILRSVGWRARTIEGGYKAFRKFVSDDTERLLNQQGLKLTVLSGQTGVAKTRLLHTLAAQGAQVLDLEGLANHKGSVLGLAPGSEQPSQKLFETRLWHALSRMAPNQTIFTEAESNRIGVLHCPASLWKKLSEATVIDIRLPLAKRAQFLLEDYPYFTESPELLKELLDKLIKLRGHKQVQEWHQQIDTCQWTDFVESVLRDHYDLVYRRAGDEKSNYQSPSSKLELNDFSENDLTTAALALIDRAQSSH